jgi:tartrate dehydrogenase/decarboxylase/D-malate dehydrogenase
MLFVREGTEGEYLGLGDRVYPNTPQEFALQTSVFSRRGCQRVIRWAFELARSQGRSLTSVSKGNALQYSAVLWDEVFEEAAAAYPDVEARGLLVDAAAYLMVKYPERFEVVVASNLFADILTDLGAALMGGLGFAPSASLNPERRFPSTFEPVHGSAPDIAGTGVANPIGAIWSAALMLDHLGHPAWRDHIVGAIGLTLASGEVRPIDIGGNARTEDVSNGILSRLPTALTPSAPSPNPCRAISERKETH